VNDDVPFVRLKPGVNHSPSVLTILVGLEFFLLHSSFVLPYNLELRASVGNVVSSTRIDPSFMSMCLQQLKV